MPVDPLVDRLPEILTATTRIDETGTFRALIVGDLKLCVFGLALAALVFHPALRIDIVFKRQFTLPAIGRIAQRPRVRAAFGLVTRMLAGSRSACLVRPGLVVRPVALLEDDPVTHHVP